MRTLPIILSIFIYLLLPCQAHSATNQNLHTLKAISLADYISADYHNAIAPEGEKILNPSEWEEMKDFSGLISRYLSDIPASDSLHQEINLLVELIANKKEVAIVTNQAKKIKASLVKRFNIATEPDSKPNLKHGAEIFEKNCSSCHGKTGWADTEIAKGLTPKPTAFADPKVIANLSAFQAKNTIFFGIENTAMPAFNNLSEQDRWDVASYLFTLGTPSTSTENSATGIKKSLELIKESLAQAELGNFDHALDLSVSAYLDGFESSEVLLKTIGQGPLVAQTETSFISLREKLKQKNIVDTRKSIANITEILNQAKEKINAQNSLSANMVFVAAFTIIFREGLEAILLLAIIFSLLSKLKVSIPKKYLNASWSGALMAGFFTWLIFRKIISGAAREGMEGWIGLIAASILIYVSFWLHGKKTVEAWTTFLLGKIKGEKSVKIFSVLSVVFLAVYREVFETILFLETLTLQNTTGPLPLLAGFAVSFITLIFVAWFIFKLGKKIPIGIFFGVSSYILYFMAIVFVGQSLHNLQEANFISSTALPFITIPSLGIFPSVETILAQGILLSLFIGNLIWQQMVKVPYVESKLEHKVNAASLKLFNAHELEEHLMEHISQLKNTLSKGHISEEEIKEIMGHMEELDKEIHQVILRLAELESGIPRRFDEIFQEVEGLQKAGTHKELVDKALSFKNHLESMRKH